MEENQIELISSLVKKLKAKKKQKDDAVKTLQSAKILTKGENFSSNYKNLNKVFA